MSDQPLYSNRLIYQKSPYLLQHAHNPVDWYPWGEEAFQASREGDKPIFLSIGYATCHWCHVMEQESFENIEIAQKMNEAFINIKIDREELPDVDSLYMEFAQGMMSGVAGWPLNLILTPELEPFFASTYLPPYSSHGIMGLSDLIKQIRGLWMGEERNKILAQAEQIVDLFADNIRVRGDVIPDEPVISQTAELLFKMADPIYGGIKGAPKFPVGYQSCFLMRFFTSSKDSRALFIVELTLDMMHRGGIYDHLGGGFSRYSVDEQWLVPHFEKMLYDNAILAQAYLEAWQLTKKPIYRKICEEILQYILRDMTHSEGGFYSAEDSDSEGHEGLFYTWNYDEIKNILSGEHELFCEYYDITPQGNFEGRNILNTKLSLIEFASRKNLDEQQLESTFEIQREKLWKEREKRIRPLKDDKILSAWNGLMIYTFAEAGKAFSSDLYLKAANKAARFIKKNLWVDQALLRRWRDNQAMFSGSLDEYAFMIRGLLSLFEANAGIEWLEWAMDLARTLKEHYKSDGGAFYQTDGEDKNLLLRRCQLSDGAEPSGNAIHTENLLRLYQLTGESHYLQQAEDVLRAVKSYLENYPPGYCFHVMNLHRYYSKKSVGFVIALNSKGDHQEELKRCIFENFIPHKVVIWQNQDLELEELLPSIKEEEPIKDMTTLYICREGICQTHLTELAPMLKEIEKW